MASDQKKADSVFDFLYVDHDRIGLLLSQLSDDGVLTEIIRQSEDADESDWGFDLKVVKGQNKNGGKRALHRRFNPRWLLPLLFLDRAKDLFFEPDDASTGALIKSEGTLALLNTELVQRLYKTESLRAVALKKARDNAKAQQEPFDLQVAKIEIDAITTLEPQVQAHLFRGDSYRLWSTLRPDGLITPASELSIKHGSILTGSWTIVGIMDALPWDANVHAETQRILLERFSSQGFLQETIQLNDVVRSTYGRAPDSIGVTTLLIFREVAGRFDPETTK